MSVRATRGPETGTAGNPVTGGFAGGVAATGRAADFCGVADLCCTNQTRKDSSEIVTPIAESDSTMMRTEVPAALSRTSTVLYGSSMVALPVRFAFASAISAASCWAFARCFVGIRWEIIGDCLGKAKGNTGIPLGINRSENRLDVGVSSQF